MKILLLDFLLSKIMDEVDEWIGNLSIAGYCVLVDLNFNNY